MKNIFLNFDWLFSYECNKVRSHWMDYCLLFSNTALRSYNKVIPF